MGVPAAVAFLAVAAGAHEAGLGFVADDRHGIGAEVMVLAGGRIEARRPAELGREDDRRLLEHRRIGVERDLLELGAEGIDVVQSLAERMLGIVIRVGVEEVAGAEVERRGAKDAAGKELAEEAAEAGGSIDVGGRREAPRLQRRADLDGARRSVGVAADRRRRSRFVLGRL